VKGRRASPVLGAHPPPGLCRAGGRSSRHPCGEQIAHRRRPVGDRGEAIEVATEQPGARPDIGSQTASLHIGDRQPSVAA